MCLTCDRHPYSCSETQLSVTWSEGGKPGNSRPYFVTAPTTNCCHVCTCTNYSLADQAPLLRIAPKMTLIFKTFTWEAAGKTQTQDIWSTVKCFAYSTTMHAPAEVPCWDTNYKKTNTHTISTLRTLSCGCCRYGLIAIGLLNFFCVRLTHVTELANYIIDNIHINLSGFQSCKTHSLNYLLLSICPCFYPSWVYAISTVSLAGRKSFFSCCPRMQSRPYSCFVSKSLSHRRRCSPVLEQEGQSRSEIESCCWQKRLHLVVANTPFYKQHTCTLGTRVHSSEVYAHLLIMW